MFENDFCSHAAEISGDAVKSATSKLNLFILSEGTGFGFFGAFLGRTSSCFVTTVTSSLRTSAAVGTRITSNSHSCRPTFSCMSPTADSCCFFSFCSYLFFGRPIKTVSCRFPIHDAVLWCLAKFVENCFCPQYVQMTLLVRASFVLFPSSFLPMIR